MITYNNFTAAIPLADYSAETWKALVRDRVSTEAINFDEVKMRMLRNTYMGTSHVLKSYIDQILNGAINHYNVVLTTAYNKIAALEAQVTNLQEELIRLPRGNVGSKAKVPEPPTFAGSENKMHLHDWLS